MEHAFSDGFPFAPFLYYRKATRTEVVPGKRRSRPLLQRSIPGRMRFSGSQLCQRTFRTGKIHFLPNVVAPNGRRIPSAPLKNAKIASWGTRPRVRKGKMCARPRTSHLHFQPPAGPPRGRGPKLFAGKAFRGCRTGGWRITAGWNAAKKVCNIRRLERNPFA